MNGAVNPHPPLGLTAARLTDTDTGSDHTLGNDSIVHPVYQDVYDNEIFDLDYHVGLD